MRIYKVLSALLEYPEQELIDHLPEIRAVIDENADIDAEESAALLKFLDFLESKSLIEVQADYVDTFDRTPEHSLHLTHHLFGEESDRNRGPALIDLSEYYKSYGLKSVSIWDYWGPPEAVNRIVCGAGVNQMRVAVNGDFHEFVFSGAAMDVLDSSSFEAGQAGLSWAIVLKKREGFRKAFHGFDEGEVLDLLEELHGVADGHYGLGGVVRDLDAEFFLESHNQLDNVEAVGAEVFDERSLGNGLLGGDAELLHDDLLHFFFHAGH